MNQPKEWSISQFYKRAWKLTWQHKKLWILGFAVAIYASGGNSFQGNFRLPSSSGSSEKTAVTSPTKTSVLPPSGKTATSPTALPDKSIDHVMDGLKAVSPAVYVLLGIEVLAVFIGIFVLYFILVSWSKAALMIGVGEVVETDTLHLTEVAKAAIGRIKSLVWIAIVPGLLFFLSVFAVMIVLMLIIAFAGPIGVIGAIVLFCAGIYFWFRLMVGIIYAERYCALEKLSGKEAFKKGYSASKGNIWKSLRLALANGLVSMFVPFLAVIPAIGFGVAAFWPLINGGHVQYALIVPFVLSAVFAMVFLTVFGGVWQVFSYTTWHFAFQYTKKNI